MLSYHVAKQMKPHTICETLLMPCMKDVVGAVIGKEHVKKLDKIPCSYDTVARRTREMASDVQDQVIDKLKSAGKFSLAVDESCDVSGSPQLIVFVHFVNNSVIAEELLCCLELKTTTREYTPQNAVSFTPVGTGRTLTGWRNEARARSEIRDDQPV
ncbi:hypothetical protein HPB52_011966 [Rhipicephalus sanguineus]|uniref:DUF4371 domain-containing protein n=1 Tax=Rhipicephalus sanguineus TaxID=34632 RepID=A0A9D4PMI1_RHISA|nr:hypothetical protein HPB52_011966 [Rhipicephalus sanguineus]